MKRSLTLRTPWIVSANRPIAMTKSPYSGIEGSRINSASQVTDSTLRPCELITLNSTERLEGGCVSLYGPSAPGNADRFPQSCAPLKKTDADRLSFDP